MACYGSCGFAWGHAIGVHGGGNYTSRIRHWRIGHWRTTTHVFGVDREPQGDRYELMLLNSQFFTCWIIELFLFFASRLRSSLCVAKHLANQMSEMDSRQMNSTPSTQRRTNHRAALPGRARPFKKRVSSSDQ